MPYWRLHYHLVWATRDRRPLLGDSEEQLITAVVQRKARLLRIRVHAIGSTADHIHLAVSLPPTLNPADCVRHLKGASSRAINAGLHPFAWQSEYGALTLGERALPAVVDYVLRQKEHHTRLSTIPALERTTTPTGRRPRERATVRLERTSDP